MSEHPDAFDRRHSVDQFLELLDAATLELVDTPDWGEVLDRLFAAEERQDPRAWRDAIAAGWALVGGDGAPDPSHDLKRPGNGGPDDAGRLSTAGDGGPGRCGSSPAEPPVHERIPSPGGPAPECPLADSAPAPGPSGAIARDTDSIFRPSLAGSQSYNATQSKELDR